MRPALAQIGAIARTEIRFGLRRGLLPMGPLLACGVGAVANLPGGYTLVAMATIALAHQLNLEVVGEGVETEFQKRFLEDQGCDLLQGHLLGHAAPRDEIMTRLREAGPAAAAPTRGD